MNKVAAISGEGSAKSSGLQKSISPAQFAVFGFGSVVGTAWVLLVGGWLFRAGPIGTLIGIALAGTAMVLIAAMYAELASRFPRTGGEITFINAVFGKPAGFVVGWLLTLAYLSNLVFEGVALAWLVGILWPPLTGPTLYVIFGEPIGAGGLLLALAASLTIAVLNYRGARSFVLFQNALTVTFLLIVAVAVIMELSFGSAQNMRPLWQAGNGESWAVGILWVFGSAPMIFNSFQSVLQTIEERSPTTSKETVVRICFAVVGFAALFYLLIVVAAIQAAPWMRLATSGLPAVDALADLPGARILTVALLIALIASLLKAWNAVFMTSVRFLFAQSRDGMIPPIFANVNPATGAPGKAVIAVALFNFVGMFLGKGLLEPIVNIMSVCVASTFALICTATLVMRRRDPGHDGFRLAGGTPVGLIALASAVAMIVFALVQPAATQAASAFKWVLLISWTVLGLILYLSQNSKLPVNGHMGSSSAAEP